MAYDMNFFSYETYIIDTDGSDLNDGDPIDEGETIGHAFNARAGVEILAGPHVGFYTDFLFRLAPLNLENVGADATYSGEDFTVEPPKFGVSGGINFYF